MENELLVVGEEKEKPKKKGKNFFTDFFSKIETEEKAHEVIKTASTTFLSMGGIIVVISFLLMYWNSPFGGDFFISGGLYIMLGGLLYKSANRGVAITALVMSASDFVYTIMSRFGLAEGGKNIILALIVLAFAFRAVQATFKLNQIYKSQKKDNPNKPTDPRYPLSNKHIIPTLLIGIVLLFVIGWYISPITELDFYMTDTLTPVDGDVYQNGVLLGPTENGLFYIPKEELQVGTITIITTINGEELEYEFDIYEEDLGSVYIALEIPKEDSQFSGF